MRLRGRLSGLEKNISGFGNGSSGLRKKLLRFRAWLCRLRIIFEAQGRLSKLQNIFEAQGEVLMTWEKYLWLREKLFGLEKNI